jgi:hypothetical protein
MGTSYHKEDYGKGGNNISTYNLITADKQKKFDNNFHGC